MDASSIDATPSQRRAARPSRASASTARKAQPRRASSHARVTAPSSTPFDPRELDLESLEQLRATATRKVRALVRDEPLLALGGAFASGFVLGGGWRTRVGRMMLLAATRYVVLQAAQRYLHT
jgi:hypothetical protein